MSPVDKLITVLWVLIVIVWQAAYQAHLFAQNKPINHQGKAWIFFGAVAFLALLFAFNGHSLRCLYEIPVIAVLERAALFDGILNWLRKPRRSFWYNSYPEIPEGSNRSWFDQLENNLSAFWLKVLKVGYIVAFLIVTYYI